MGPELDQAPVPFFEDSRLASRSLMASSIPTHAGAEGAGVIALPREWGLILNIQPEDPAFIIDRDRRIHYRNAAADTLLAEASVAALRHGRLALLARAAADHFATLMATIEPWKDGATFYGLPMATPGRRRPILLKIDAIPQAHDVGRERFLVVIADLDRRSSTPLDGLLHSVFGFTKAESRVALGLFEGKSVGELARDLAISVATVRTHIKRIFVKADVRRQSELIRLLARLAGLVLGSDAIAGPDKVPHPEA